MFKPLLNQVLDKCDGAVAACVMAFDGIAVESVSRADDIDPQAMGAELAFVLTQIRKAAETLELGGVEEVVVRSEKLTYVVRMLSVEFFVGLVVLPKGNLGKGRFLVRKALPELQANL